MTKNWKKKLEHADTSDLLNIIEQIIKNYPEAKTFLETTILGDDEKIIKVLEKYKLTIQKAMLPGLETGKTRFKETLHLMPLKKLLTEFKKLKPKPELIFELYIHYCDCLTKYLQLYADYGCWFDVPGFSSKYDSLEIAMDSLLKLVEEYKMTEEYYPIIKAKFVENIIRKEEVKSELAHSIKKLLGN